MSPAIEKLIEAEYLERQKSEEDSKEEEEEEEQLKLAKKHLAKARKERKKNLHTKTKVQEQKIQKKRKHGSVEVTSKPLESTDVKTIYTRLSKKAKANKDLVVLNTPENNPPFTVAEVKEWEPEEVLVHWWGSSSLEGPWLPEWRHRTRDDHVRANVCPSGYEPYLEAVWTQAIKFKDVNLEDGFLPETVIETLI